MIRLASRTILGSTRSAARVVLGVAIVASGIAGSSGQGLAQTDSDGDGVWDVHDAFPCDPRGAAVAIAPGENAHGMVMFEDEWPSSGDADFNDIVLTYNYDSMLDASGQAVFLRGTFNALAIGGIYTNGLAIQLPVHQADVRYATLVAADGTRTSLVPSAGDANATYVLFDDLRTLHGGLTGTINSEPNRPVQPGVSFELEVELWSPKPIDLAAAPFDLFIFRTGDPTHEIHGPQYSGTSQMDTSRFGTHDDGSSPGRWFVDQQGLPFQLIVPEGTPWPSEATAVSTLWPNVATFASSGGTQATDFYSSSVVASSAYTPATGSRPSATFLHPNGAPGVVDTSCVPGASTGITIFGGVTRADVIRDQVMDNQGTIYVAGGVTNLSRPGIVHRGPGGDFDGYVARIPSGQTTPDLELLIGTTSGEEIFDIAVDGRGHIYVHLWALQNAVIDGVPIQGFGFQIVELAPDGSLVRALPLGRALMTMTGRPGGGVIAVEVSAVDEDPRPEISDRHLIVAYDAQGQIEWTRRGLSLPTAGYANVLTVVQDMLLTANGDLVVLTSVSGTSTANASIQQYVLTRFATGPAAPLSFHHAFLRLTRSPTGAIETREFARKHGLADGGPLGFYFGSARTTATSNELHIRRYGTSAPATWTYVYPHASSLGSPALARSPWGGDIFGCSTQTGSFGTTDELLVRVDTSGQEVYAASRETAWHTSAIFCDVSGGTVHASGTTSPNPGNARILLTTYRASDGVRQP